MDEQTATPKPDEKPTTPIGLKSDKPAKPADPADNGRTYATAEEILARAPSDLREEDFHVTEWDTDEKEFWVKLRTLTAAERARIRQVGVGGLEQQVSWAEMEVQQFLVGVIEPKFNEHQVRKLHQSSGAGFAQIIAAHDDLSAMGKEALATARTEFRED